MPGDRVEIRNDHLIINGETIALEPNGRYNDGCYVNVSLSVEKLGEHTHQVMSCHSPVGLQHSKDRYPDGNSELPQCGRAKLAREYGNYLCDDSASADFHSVGDKDMGLVPAGHYLMIGDNRDNSADGRSWGFVPDSYLVGKATRIWFNFDLERSGTAVFNWSRIGDAID